MWRIATGASATQIYSSTDISFAEIIRQATPPDSLILHAPIHNSPVGLAGRRSLIGFPGHVWTHGIDPSDRESQIRKIYAGKPDADRLIRQYGINYAVVTPAERALMQINDKFFRDKFSVVTIEKDYTLYKYVSSKE